MRVSKKEASHSQCFRCIDDMTKVATQYFEGMDFNFFGHFSVYPNGKYWMLCTGGTCPMEVFLEEKISPSGFGIYDRTTEKILFPSIDKGENFSWTRKVADATKERFGILNPMMFVQKFEDHSEAFIFDFHCANVYEKYINHFEIFENFIHYHKEKARDLIKNVGKLCLMDDKNYRGLDKKYAESLSDDWNNLEFVQPKKYYLRHKGKAVSVSANEYECLSLVSHGLQFSRVAKKMGVSPRTVETYFNRLKRKLNLFDRDEVVTVYWKNKILSV